MLVLSRKTNEEVIIGDGQGQIVLTIIDIRGDKVRLGFTAHESIRIHRREIAEQTGQIEPKTSPPSSGE